MSSQTFVAPFVGAWIEIVLSSEYRRNGDVAPFVGAWIEMGMRRSGLTGSIPSLPSWERGLKWYY